MTVERIRGAGGKKPKNPIYTNDNLFSEDSIELLLGIGEGPIFGLENGAQSLFVGDVPLKRAEGASIVDNFSNLRTNPLTVGGVSEDPNRHRGLPLGTAQNIVFQKGGDSASVDVGTQVLYTTPVIRYTPSNMRGRIRELEVRVNIAQLGIEDENGSHVNTAHFRVEWKKSLESTWNVLTTHLDPPTWPTTHDFPHLPTPTSLGTSLSSRDSINEYTLEGKTGSGFIIDFRITEDLLGEILTDDDWMIRVTKNNKDYISDGSTTREVCEIIFDSFQMIGNATRVFPNTAVIHIIGTASDQFSSLPDFYGIFKGLETPVPLHYDPALADPYQFVVWDGTTENKWHSNPAWVLYDLLNNERYGYRKYVTDLVLNRNDFYEAGRWCDEKVVGDFGIYEKRYTMNITIAENQNAWEYLQNIAGAFDGILYDDGEGTVRLKVDRWVKPKVIFTPETINAEGFAYSFTDVATQYNDLTVSFSNPARGWEESRLKATYGAPDSVGEDDNGQRVNGVIPLDFVAVGCISESEAKRRARARALTASTENTLINFTTTRLGLALDPLEIFYVADPYMDWGQTGRAEVISGLEIRLRDELPFAVADLTIPYTMRIQTLSDVLVCQVMLTSPTTLYVIGDSPELEVFLNARFAEYPVFVLSGGRVPYGDPKPFRATTLEPTNNYNLFNISGLEVTPKKFEIVGDSLNPSLAITEDITVGLNLKTYFETNWIKPNAHYNTVTIVLDGTKQAVAGEFLAIIAADVNSFALTVGDWSDVLPVGVKPKVLVKGNVKIMGRGGRGGNGGGLIAVDRSNSGFDPFIEDVGFPTGPASVMGGESGQNGGPSANFDHLLDLEIESTASLEISGGYGGGYGGDGAYVQLPVSYVFGGIANAPMVMFRLAGAGGSGGRPLGLAGVAGAADRGVAGGTQGSKELGGICPARQTHRVPRDGIYILEVDLFVEDGEGHDGLPATDTNNPVPNFVSPPPSGTDVELITYAGSRVNGSQGVAITNGGNLNLTNNGAYTVTP